MNIIVEDALATLMIWQALFYGLFLTIAATSELIKTLSSPESSSRQYFNALSQLEIKEPSDESGDISRSLGQAYFFGRRHTLKPNYKKAFKYFSQLNDPASLYMTALCYSQGLGVSRSTERALVLLKMAADGGEKAAHLALGYRYAAGIGVKRTCSAARDHYYFSAKKTAKIYEQQRGFDAPKPMTLLEEPQTISAQTDMIEYYEYSASKDELKTLLLLGQIHYEGYNGAPIDYDQARRYFEQATEQGSATAKAYLGEIYLHGLGIAKDTTKAFKYFREAAQAGSAIGRNGLGMLYRDGIQVLKDQEEALQLFLKAAEDKLPEAQYNAAKLMHKLRPGIDDDKSLSLLVQAFQQGYTLAHFEIARRSINNPLLCAFTLTLLRGVVERGPEMMMMREAFEDYHAGDQAVALGKYIYLADHGYEVAQFNAAYILEKAGTFNGYRRALVYYHRAATQGNTQARIRLGDLFYHGHGLPHPDPLAAFLSYKEAYAQNSPEATFNLGFMYERGIGIPQDLHLARRFYDMAATIDKKGCPEAWFPAQIALLGLGAREVLHGLAMRTLVPHLITSILMFVGLFVALRRFAPRPAVPRHT